MKNGKGKEIRGIVAHYEGKFINGKKHGKGKEINNDGELIYEGDFYNDYRIRGKLYVKGRLEFEREFLFDKKWNGKGYDENNKIIYELINGTGKSKDYLEGWDLYFEGEYLDGKRNGKGK